MRLLRPNNLLKMLSCAAMLAASAAAAPARADTQPRDQFAQAATWRMPKPDQVREQAMAWLKDQKIDEESRKRAEALWQNDEPRSDNRLLERLAATFAVADGRVQPLVELCSGPRRQPVLPKFDWLSDKSTSPIVRNNLRLLLGRWLAREKLYDEAHEQLAELRVEDVVDPATLLFYQGVVHHRMLHKEPGLKAVSRLLENQQEIPRRYASLARLMQADLAELKDESLDHIARRMDDIQRRLELGRAGPKVRGVEDGVIKSLDKLIEQIEKAQAAAAAAAGSGGGSMRPSSPMPDSRLARAQGAGNVDKKNIGSKSGWGDLPPKQRQEALQQIGKEFPAHYRDLVEQYFRKLANEDTQEQTK